MKLLFYLSLFFLLKLEALAQPICGFDESNRIFQQTFPGAQESQKKNEKRIQGLLKQQVTPQIVSIPIVVHVLHTGDTIGSPYNPTDAKIHEAIDYLNEIYSGSHISLTPAGADAAGDIGIRFEFAKRDPECNPTNGIRRINMSENELYLEHGALNDDLDYDTNLKSPIAWDIGRYYNIYVVNKINGNNGSLGQYVAGFAYFPVNNIVDGIVILASEMKSGSKTLIHEIGHAFNLYHPFQGSGNRDECPSGDGDFVDDTDPIAMNADIDGIIDFTCRSGINTCNNAPYSIRTESNIMNYTACYTLFTPGQKARMRASLMLEARASLLSSNALIATFEGNGQACDPKINFEEDEVVVPLPMVQKTGCREFKDYTFYFTISNNPSEQVTVVLSKDVSSDATEKVDFDFIGGKEVVFPAGSRQKKPFKIRVYDVGERELPEKLMLNFTVNGGQGNTLKGTARPVMNIWLKPNNTKPVAENSVNYIHIGSENRHIDGVFDNRARLQRSIIQYTKEEMVNAGMVPGGIIGMELFVVKYSKRPFKNLKIKMAHALGPVLVNSGGITGATASQQVFSAPSYSTTDGSNLFLFSQPFIWNGKDDIRVETCFDNGSEDEDGENDHIIGYGGGLPPEEQQFLSSGHACNSTITGFSYYGEGIKPVIVFSQVTVGNPVAVNKTISQQKYLGPHGELFFYDDSNPQKIIASVKNLSDWNFGCTKMEIDRSGTRAFPFWSMNPGHFVTEKTFLLIPQYTQADKMIEVKLYYTSDEKLGYEEMTQANWDRIQLFKTNGTAVGTINPINQQVSRVELSANAQNDNFGSHYVLSATFNSGLADRSGFAAGLINSVLPLDWLQFTGVPKETFTSLDWITANEINTSHFEVEASRDGISFTSLGQLSASGIGTNTYNYQHQNPEAGIWYYRLKQVDNDQKYTYSPIIRIRQGGGQIPIIYPVPTGDLVTIDFGRSMINTTIKVLTADLKPVLIEKITTGEQKKQISTAKLPAGSYMVQIISPTDNYVLRFIKY